jgi:hypothetical protein
MMSDNHGTLDDIGTDKIINYKYCSFDDLALTLDSWQYDPKTYIRDSIIREILLFVLISLGLISAWLMQAKDNKGWNRVAAVAAVPVSALSFYMAGRAHYHTLASIVLAGAVLITVPAVAPSGPLQKGRHHHSNSTTSSSK